LVAEDEDLEVLRVLVALTEISDDDEANESPEDKVEERPHRPMVPRGPERESEFPTPTGPMPQRKITVRFDRPFLFLLRDIDTGAVLFMGQVTDPSVGKGS
jgi:hypothetical protein